MLIKESTLRRIIREEAHRALREDANVIPATAPAGGAIQPGVSNPADETSATPDQVAQAAYESIKDPKTYGAQLLKVWENFPKNGVSTSFATFQFQINTNGTVDPKTIKVNCKPDPSGANTSPPLTFSGELKKVIAGFKFMPGTEAFVYEHPKPMEFGAK